MYWNRENRRKIRNLWSMTKKRVIRNFCGWKSRNFSGKGNILKIVQSENFSKIWGNLKQGGNASWSQRGMDAPVCWNYMVGLPADFRPAVWVKNVVRLSSCTACCQIRGWVTYLSEHGSNVNLCSSDRCKKAQRKKHWAPMGCAPRD